ncbi:MAG: hypothetical protein E1N59_1403 [Puniceicoccaceae bacterium 5H]|nr:MAG: hypothetical protein E1N59_1403 [Puniceicoccaceae bacterium 5H]
MSDQPYYQVVFKAGVTPEEINYYTAVRGMIQNCDRLRLTVIPMAITFCVFFSGASGYLIQQASDLVRSVMTTQNATYPQVLIFMEFLGYVGLSLVCILIAILGMGPFSKKMKMFNDFLTRSVTICVGMEKRMFRSDATELALTTRLEPLPDAGKEGSALFMRVLEVWRYALLGWGVLLCIYALILWDSLLGVLA